MGTERVIDGRIVKNFALWEMANNNASDKTKLNLTPEMVSFAMMIQELREWFAKPMTVNSWYRTKSFNASCGGSSNSLHLDGLAMDWAVKHTNDQRENVKTKWMEICTRHGKIGGINYYTNGYHISIGEQKFGYESFVFRDYRGRNGDW